VDYSASIDKKIPEANASGKIDSSTRKIKD